MACERPVLAENLLAYLEGLLQDESLVEMEDHLRHCEACRRELEELKETDAMLDQAAARVLMAQVSICPQEEELESLARDPGELAPATRKTLEAHLLRCAACGEAVQALKRFQAEYGDTSQAFREESRTLPEAVRDAVREEYRTWGSVPWWRRLADSLGPPRLAWAAAVVLVLFMGLGIMAWLHGSTGPSGGKKEELALNSRMAAAPPAEVTENRPDREFHRPGQSSQASLLPEKRDLALKESSAKSQAELETGVEAASPQPAGRVAGVAGGVHGALSTPSVTEARGEKTEKPAPGPRPSPAGPPAPAVATKSAADQAWENGGLAGPTASGGGAPATAVATSYPEAFNARSSSAASAPALQSSAAPPAGAGSAASEPDLARRAQTLVDKALGQGRAVARVQTQYPAVKVVVVSAVPLDAHSQDTLKRDLEVGLPLDQARGDSVTFETGSGRQP